MTTETRDRNGDRISTAYELAIRLRALGFDAKHEDGGRAGDWVVMKLTPLPEVLCIGNNTDDWGANTFASFDAYENFEMLDDGDIGTGLSADCDDVNVIARALLNALHERLVVRSIETTNAVEWIGVLQLADRITEKLDLL